MAKVTLKGNEIHTNGELPKVGTEAPDFKGVKSDLSELSLSDLKGKKVVINVFPSLDTSVCAASVRRFNKELPFAHGRFCTTEGIDKVITLSVFRCSCFEDKYGMLLVDSPLKGLLARGVIVVDGAGKVVYEELVPEITTEPNYDAALAALK